MMFSGKTDSFGQLTVLDALEPVPFEEAWRSGPLATVP